MLSPWKRLTRAAGLRGLAARAEEPSFDRKSVDVLARFAHEARQPLSAARAAFALMRLSLDDGQRERASVIIDRQFVRLARLFDDLLEAGRLRLGTTSLRVERVDLRRLVVETAESIRPQLTEKDQHLVTHVPEKPVWMDGDPVRLEQVISNLLVNGTRYTGPGGRVSVDLAHRPADAVLTVGDTGRGISADVLPHIFEPFMRGEGAPEQGLGLGLTIARQLVELHGGTICATSAGPNQGSEFVVTFPAPSSRRMAPARPTSADTAMVARRVG
jgi:two-component system, sensor histidine kinase